MESIEYASLPDDNVVVIRVSGRGNHSNSLALREVIRQTSGGQECPQFIFDLEGCATLDSTFMGVMAGIAMKAQTLTGKQAIVVNASDHVNELLENLGLKFIMELRRQSPMDDEAKPNESAYQLVQIPNAGKIDRIVCMIEAHEQLVDLTGENEVQFRGVLKSLQDSLNRSRGEKNDN